MRNKKLEYTAVGILIGAAFAIVFAIIIATVVPARNTKAEKYDLGCTTQLKKNPLKECKQEQ